MSSKILLLVFLSIAVIFLFIKIYSTESFASQNQNCENCDPKSLDPIRTPFDTSTNVLDGVKLGNDYISVGEGDDEKVAIDYDQTSNTLTFDEFSTSTLAPYTGNTITMSNDDNTIRFPHQIYNLRDLRANNINIDGEFSANSMDLQMVI